jgi:hypothetical protein
MKKTPDEDNLIKRILKSDPILVISVSIALIGLGFYQPYAALSTLVGISIMGLVFQTLHWTTKPKTTDNAPATKTSFTSQAQSSSRTLKNVWEVGKGHGKSSVDKSQHDEKPFGSKYYYAHNNPNATGGYKDGLRMEDYRMNGPRLLSKGGQRVEEESEQPTSEIENSGHAKGVPSEPSSEQSTSQQGQVSTIAISKYLWEDPGDWEGIGTIRIDTLPGQGGSRDTLDWKDAAVKDVSADLVGLGLLVKISTDRVNYQLKINKLYGNAFKVEALRKTKRLLIKIHKKKSGVVALLDKSNLEAWPHPHKTV